MLPYNPGLRHPDRVLRRTMTDAKRLLWSRECRLWVYVIVPLAMEFDPFFLHDSRSYIMGRKSVKVIS
jgi:hypothetical protein